MFEATAGLNYHEPGYDKGGMTGAYRQRATVEISFFSSINFLNVGTP